MKLFLNFVVLAITFTLPVLGADAKPPAPSPDVTASAGELPQTKSLEGVKVEALETLPDLDKNQLGIAFGFSYPFTPYYTGFFGSVFYARKLSRNISWQILDLTFVTTSDTALTSQVAQNYNLSIQPITKPQYMVSSSFFFTHTRGKLLFVSDYIRSFSSALILGVGYLSTSASPSGFGSLGLSFDFTSNDWLSWRFEMRDLVATTGDNYTYFNIGTMANF